MQRFKIEIQEVLNRIVYINAESKEEALEKVRKLCFDQEITLDAQDFAELKISICPNHDNRSGH